MRALGVVWGDVEPDDIRVDECLIVCLIHFGIGYPAGWAKALLRGRNELLRDV